MNFLMNIGGGLIDIELLYRFIKPLNVREPN